MLGQDRRRIRTQTRWCSRRRLGFASDVQRAVHRPAPRRHRADGAGSARLDCRCRLRQGRHRIEGQGCGIQQRRPFGQVAGGEGGVQQRHQGRRVGPAQRLVGEAGIIAPGRPAQHLQQCRRLPRLVQQGEQKPAAAARLIEVAHRVRRLVAWRPGDEPRPVQRGLQREPVGPEPGIEQRHMRNGNSACACGADLSG